MTVQQLIDMLNDVENKKAGVVIFHGTHDRFYEFKKGDISIHQDGDLVIDITNR